MNLHSHIGNTHTRQTFTTECDTTKKNKQTEILNLDPTTTPTPSAPFILKRSR